MRRDALLDRDAAGEGMFVAESLTNSASSIFWETAVIIVLTVALVVVAIFAWRSAVIRRRLLISITSRSQLLSAPESMRDDLQIRYKGEPIGGQLYVTAIELANVGKAHIGSNEFDKERPLTFSLDAEIIKHLSTEHSPASAPSPEVTAGGTTFSLMPELITRGEIIEIALLTEGRPTRIQTEFKPFGDVSIDIGERGVLQSKQARRARIAGIAAMVLAVLLAALGFVITINASGRVTNSTKSLENGTICEELKNDTTIALAALLVLSEQGSEVESNSPNEPALVRSYDRIAVLAAAELVLVDGDYRSLAANGASVSDMISWAQKAINTADEAAKLNNRQSIIKFASQLTPIGADLSSRSATPSVC